MSAFEGTPSPPQGKRHKWMPPKAHLVSDMRKTGNKWEINYYCAEQLGVETKVTHPREIGGKLRTVSENRSGRRR